MAANHATSESSAPISRLIFETVAKSRVIAGRWRKVQGRNWAVRNSEAIGWREHNYHRKEKTKMLHTKIRVVSVHYYQSKEAEEFV